MRIVFAGSPVTAVPTLDALIAAGHDVVAVVTRPDAPVGRRRVLTPSPVATAAEERDLTVIRAARLDADATEQILATDPELGVIVAFGGLVREPLLSGPSAGWINLHFSALPAWRGASPVQQSIAHRSGAGATVFQLVPDLDAGPVWSRRERELTGEETSGALLAELAVSGAADVVSVVDAIARGERPLEQTGEPSFAPKLTAADARIDWDRAALDVIAHIRAMTPEPGAHTSVGETRVKVLAVDRATGAHPALEAGTVASTDTGVFVGTATEPIRLVTVQPAGKKEMDAASWWRGLGVDRGAEVAAS
ncbi:methionyl-tRNA formyltransferase [Labedella gwakjiensis]|uniref:Methionyl-tRNA formyltransferase n=1 Tax=Labedella gwakjiensis TaxID=390269 RepID=A0A2P8GZV6_9MICO|nr:methionyl-tRNA formyltransferase [Labedella gwakjiensis]PSL39489.1 methionyl-tRNA formyltransferase [Labedella gwakjiensis]RUQ86111.1 methionyl-tRNA formyltransferase [Labedella gwakjiensis]